MLVLAIVASSALVFTNRVELLKLAVIVALWAAVVAAFVSFIYRRQSDVDQAKTRDLKLVYDLQLDREISARREYELSIETQLRRELAAEMRAQSADEVASLRAELAALRANLEIIFDTDLQSRPAIETERTTVHRFGNWDAVAPGAATAERAEPSYGPGRVISSRIDAEAQDDSDPNTEESPIIDVPAEPQPPDDEWSPQVFGGAHRRAFEREPAADWRGAQQETPRPEPAPQEGRRRAPEPEPVAETRLPWLPQPEPSPPPPPPAPRPEPERPGRHGPAGSGWRPAPAEGRFIPAGAPGSNWTAAQDDGAATPSTPTPSTPAPSTPAPAPVPNTPVPSTPTPAPAMTPPPVESPRGGRHYPAAAAETPVETPETPAEAATRARHSAPDDVDPGRRTPPTLASPPPPAPETARHRGPDDEASATPAEDDAEPAGQHIGGQPVSELMARLQVGSSGGGRRRRREE
ncbi:hypothetical protein MMAD_49120 [Mycolicibacterium madagascariense]|uniref:DUF6779 domain-containing protein n=1 Tax=Mycolicibacterium madagascariense TaxID=212765 RepID=A0A7I7XN08_9MYCO|nr:hypothetical protein MMAD_49120 [Mycolicibacterium madagascariense]